MLAKLLTLVKSKAAAAVLGVLLVGGGSSAVAVAATQGHLNGLGLQMASSKGQSSDQAGSNSSANANKGHAEGMLTACNATGGTIVVTDGQGAPHTFTVTSSTKFNGAIHGNNKGGSTSASHPTFGLTQLCAMVNHVKVQVQATASTSGSATTYTATKVTVEGPGAANAGSDSAGNSGDHGAPTGAGKPSDVPTPNGHSSSGSGTSADH